MQSSGQSVCIPNEITAFGVRGRIITVGKEDAFPDVLVRVFDEAEKNEDKRLIASSKTDDNGYFEFVNLKEGNYFIEASPLGFAPYEVRVRKSNDKKLSNKENSQEIIIVFGDDMAKPCRGNYSELRSTK